MNTTIQDNLFAPFSQPGIGGMHCAPSHFTWQPVPSSTPARFYTDFCMRSAVDKPGFKVGWLVEAPPYAQCHYDWAKENQRHFDYILTYVKEYTELGDKWLFYPHGGSHVPPEYWGVYRKTKLASMLASYKDETAGHKLRHEIKDRFGDRVDVLGSINGEHVSKLEAIAPYCYSIVVAAERVDWCFSDHLIDCLALGTIPIYWGCPKIDKFFNAAGIHSFRTTDDLENILADYISTEAYWVYRKGGVVRENLEEAKKYRVAEDWIYTNYGFLFEENND